MEQGGTRIAVFLLLGVAGVTGLSALFGSEDPQAASAVESPAEPGLSSGRATTEPELDGSELEGSEFEGFTEDSLGDSTEEPTRLFRRSGAQAEQGARLSAFLALDHTLVLPRPRPEPYDWSWEDDSMQIAFDGCKPVARDPLVPKAKLSVKAPIDFDTLGAIEEHFGFDPADVFELQNSIGEETEYTLSSHLGPDVVAALAKRGVIVDENSIRPDYPWIVEQTSRHLKPLAQAIVGEWKRSMPASTPSASPRPGNIIRSSDTIEALTSFVQRALPYQSIPNLPGQRERCGVRTPGPSLKLGSDCDSKALLLAALLRSLDSQIPIVLVSLKVGERPHMLIGVGVGARECDSILDHRGKRYVLIEVTSALGVGVMAPDYNDAILERYTVVP